MTEWMQFPLVIPLGIVIGIAVLAYIVIGIRLIRLLNHRFLDCVVCFGTTSFVGALSSMTGNMLIVLIVSAVFFLLVLFLIVLAEGKLRSLSS